MSVGPAVAVGAGAGTVMDLLGIGKAYLKVFEPQIVKKDGKPAEIKPKSPTAEDEFAFDFNPDKLSFSRKANVKQTAQAGGQSAPETQLLGPDPEEHSFDLFYSRFELPDLGGGAMLNSLTKIKERLVVLVQAHKKTTDTGMTPMRPLVQFGWGPFVSKYSFVESVDVTYEMFLPNGSPMRMKATIKIKEARAPTEGQNPTSGAKTSRRTHTLLAGESLATVAFKEYSNAGMWRAIALENGIDDPFRLSPGQTLLLPPHDEAVELA